MSIKRVTFYRKPDGTILAVLPDMRQGRELYGCYTLEKQLDYCVKDDFETLPLAIPIEYVPLLLALIREPAYRDMDMDIFNIRTVQQLAFLAFTGHEIYEDGLLLDKQILRHRSDNGQYYIVAMKQGKNKLKEYHVKPLNVAGT